MTECSSCGTPGAVVLLSSVICPNSRCRFYDKDLANEIAKKKVTEYDKHMAKALAKKIKKSRRPARRYKKNKILPYMPW